MYVFADSVVMRGCLSIVYVGACVTMFCGHVSIVYVGAYLYSLVPRPHPKIGTRLGAYVLVWHSVRL